MKTVMGFLFLLSMVILLAYGAHALRVTFAPTTKAQAPGGKKP